VYLKTPIENVRETLSFEELNEVFLVAPFIKLNFLRSFLAALNKNVDLTVVTRWHLEDFQAGVSDLEVYEYLNSYFPDSNVFHLENLHAKHYRFDAMSFIGSANLTSTGFGEIGEAEELLVRSEFSPSIITDWELNILEKATLCDLETYLELKSQILVIENQFEVPRVEIFDTNWLPKSGYVDLASYFENAASPSRDLEYDLIKLGVSNRPSPELIRRSLRHVGVFSAVLELCATRELVHFGEIRNIVRNVGGTEDFDEATRNIFSWLLYFFSIDYEYLRGAHSEMIVNTRLRRKQR
jgi:hypothetical protein